MNHIQSENVIKICHLQDLSAQTEAEHTKLIGQQSAEIISKRIRNPHATPSAWSIKLAKRNHESSNDSGLIKVADTSSQQASQTILLPAKLPELSNQLTSETIGFQGDACIPCSFFSRPRLKLVNTSK